MLASTSSSNRRFLTLEINLRARVGGDCTGASPARAAPAVGPSAAPLEPAAAAAAEAKTLIPSPPAWMLARCRLISWLTGATLTPTSTGLLCCCCTSLGELDKEADARGAAGMSGRLMGTVGAAVGPGGLRGGDVEKPSFCAATCHSSRCCCCCCWWW